jgi:G3E family GTPase
VTVVDEMLKYLYVYLVHRLDSFEQTRRGKQQTKDYERAHVESFGRQLSEYELDKVIDIVDELNTDTAKIKCEGKNGVKPELVFGLDSKWHTLTESQEDRLNDHHAREIDIIELYVDVTNLEPSQQQALTQHLSRDKVTQFCTQLPKEDVYRVKGIVQLREDNAMELEAVLVNCAFGRCDLVNMTHQPANRMELVKLVIMGRGLRPFRENCRLFLDKFESVGALKIEFYPAKH